MRERLRVSSVCERCGRNYSVRSDQARIQRYCSSHCKHPLPIDRFWARVLKSGDDACWLWQGTKRCGYGLFSFSGVQWSAHRFAYVIGNGPLMAGLDVLHRCDNPPCVNPAHLFLGTHVDNMADMVAKRRGKPKAKLTASQASEIRASGGRPIDVAREYGISPSTVSNIRAGRVWKGLHA